jgi:diguanylate cyclase (GGDEF)-like protein
MPPILQGYTMSSIADKLAQTELFRNASPATIQMVMGDTVPIKLSPGELLLSPACENQYIYVLLAGKLSIRLGTSDSPEISELEKGVSVGEMSVIDGIPPAAYVIAKETCSVFPIHRDCLYKLIADASPVASNLLRLLTRSMRVNTQRIVMDFGQIRELTDLANVDVLTGLYNRRWMDNALMRLVEQAKKADLPLCILMIDVDHFKKYNDTQGHTGGDQALMAMGDILKTAVRPYDFSTRYGGEEFLVILPSTTISEGMAVAERIRQAAQNKTILSSEGTAMPGITISIGLAKNDQNTTFQSLIDAADAQLYRAKKEGRNCVRY